MPNFIKQLNIDGTVYDFKVSYDSDGNLIKDTYLTSETDPIYIQDKPNIALKSEIPSLDGYALSSSIPTNVSQLTNDSGYLTEHQDISGKVDKVEGMGLSSNDFTQEEKKKLGDIQPITSGGFTPAASIVSLNLNRYGIGVSPLHMEIPRATTERAGVMAMDDKVKLDSIEESANNYTHPTTSGNKHIPSGGTTGQMLVYSADGEAAWSDYSSKLQEQFNTLNTQWEALQEAQNTLKQEVEQSLDTRIDLLSYGVQWDSTNASTELTRIGNPLLHKSLPIQNSYKGCISKNGVRQYYLGATDWAYKEDMITASVLDGTDGEVCVEVMKFYGKSGSNGNLRWVRISTTQIDSTWVEIPSLHIGAYRATVNTTDSDSPKAVSVVNNTAAFRGGSNDSSKDTLLETEPGQCHLQKPRTNISRATMRIYARNAGSELLCYEYYKWIFYWNYVIEYANFNVQATYNPELTSDGYHQGGMGPGVTTVTNWDTYNSYNPIVPCGYCNEFGNGTGIKNMTLSVGTVSVTRWRGFDVHFGDIWTNLEGVVIIRPTANALSAVYSTSNPNYFDDTINNKIIVGYEVAIDGFITDFDLGEKGEIIPSKVGGSESTYMADYHYCNPTSVSLRTLLVGGSANNLSPAGSSYFYSLNDVSHAAANVGFRTVNLNKD